MILQKIVRETRNRIEADKRELSIEEMKKRIYERGEIKNFTDREVYSFERALLRDDVQLNSEAKEKIEEVFTMGFICEIKKASPSKGIIADEFPYLTIAREYEHAGAAAISVLTEPKFFLGSKRYLEEISQNVRIPVLRKDFIIDEYQIYESKIIGADAILLISSILSLDELKKYLDICNSLGMSALVETHTEEEVDKALSAGAKIIGVNNRNLNTFKVDLHNSIRLRSLVPDNVIYVAESGIRNAADINVLTLAGVDAVLIGETLMRSKDVGRVIKELKDGTRDTRNGGRTW